MKNYMDPMGYRARSLPRPSDPIGSISNTPTDTLRVTLVLEVNWTMYEILMHV